MTVLDGVKMRCMEANGGVRLTAQQTRRSRWDGSTIYISSGGGGGLRCCSEARSVISVPEVVKVRVPAFQVYLML